MFDLWSSLETNFIGKTCTLEAEIRVLVSIEKIYQTIETMLDLIFKQLEAHQNSTLCVVCSTLFGNVVEHGLSCMVYHFPDALSCGVILPVAFSLKLKKNP